MKTEYWSKKKLYDEIDKLKYELGLDITPNSYPINSKTLANKHCKDLIIEELKFSNPYICGILYKGDTSTSIALNSDREPCQQNFDCMHELVHYFFHDISECQLMCSEKSIKQDFYIEWQANEGAAQFLVPYQLFIPKYLELEEKYVQSYWEDDSIEELSTFFNVSPSVIKNRINSLETEILQYKKGQSLNSLTIISKSKAKNLGLDTLKVNQFYCKKCLSIIDYDYKYCPICGNDLFNHRFFNQKKRKGASFMIYKTEINLDENKKAKICPKCGNEEILEGKYCKICGFELFNRCTNYNQDENNGKECNEICDANARFCHKCGSETLFYVENLLCDYNKYDNNKENFKEIWQDILSELKNSGKIMLYANLLDSEFSEINSNTVRLAFKNTTEFRRVLISKEDNIKVLKDILKDKYQKEMNIKLYDLKEKECFYEDETFESILSTSSDDLPF